jgi:hypothetical protein
MRWHLRLIALCTVAALAAGCSKSDRPSEPTESSRSIASVTDLPPNTACMGDTIWSDTNCDGVQDPGEPGLGGVTVKLYECPSDVLVDETVSEASGYYALFGPAPDDYYIVVTLPDGCTFSPANVGQPGSDDIATDSDVDANGVGFCTNLHDQEIEKDMDAGICCESEPCTAEVGDRVWFDLNCNGIQDKDEPNIPGVTVTLYTCAGALLNTDVTDGNGGYLFTGVEDGSYYVCFSLPDGYVWAPKNQGAVEGADSDVNPNGCTDCFTIEDCKDNLFVDAGLCREEEEGEGCTPGFWKNHLTHWIPTGYSPNDIFDEVFDCDPPIFGDDTTLLEAASPEITHNTLAAHGVAALLNASHPGVDFGLSVGEVIDAVCDGDKDTLSDENERGCPLSGGNTTRFHGDATDGGATQGR